MSNTDIVEAYEVLRAAVAPLDAKVKKHMQGWDPILPSMLSPILRTHLPALQRASSDCMHAAERHHLIKVIFGLHTVDMHLDESGIMLSAHLHEEKKHSVEAVIREQRRIFERLQSLSKAVRELAKDIPTN